MREELCALSVADDALDQIEELVADYVVKETGSRERVDEVLKTMLTLLNQRFYPYTD